MNGFKSYTLQHHHHHRTRSALKNAQQHQQKQQQHAFYHLFSYTKPHQMATEMKFYSHKIMYNILMPRIIYIIVFIV